MVNAEFQQIFRKVVQTQEKDQYTMFSWQRIREQPFFFNGACNSKTWKCNGKFMQNGRQVVCNNLQFLSRGVLLLSRHFAPFEHAQVSPKNQTLEKKTMSLANLARALVPTHSEPWAPKTGSCLHSPSLGS